MLDAKKLLFTRPLERLFAEPHYMSGWLSINKKALQMTDNGVQWLENPPTLS